MQIAARSMTRPRGGPAPLTPALYAQDGLAHLLDAEYNNGRDLAARRTGAYSSSARWIDWATGAAENASTIADGEWEERAIRKTGTAANTYWRWDTSAGAAQTLTVEACVSGATGAQTYVWAALLGTSLIATGAQAGLGVQPGTADSAAGRYRKRETPVAGAAPHAAGGAYAGTLACVYSPPASLAVSHNGGAAVARSVANPSGDVTATRLYVGYYLAPGARIHCVRVYLRALSAAEIAANAEIDRQRFFSPGQNP